MTSSETFTTLAAGNVQCGELIRASHNFVANPGSRATRNALAAAFLSDTKVGGIVRALALKRRLPMDEVDEIRQQSAIALIQIADRGGIKDPGGAYSLAYAIADRVTLSMATGQAVHHMHTVSLDDDNDESRPLLDELADSWNEDELVEALDRQNARGKMKQIMLLRKSNSTPGEKMEHMSGNVVGGVPIDTTSFGKKEVRAQKPQRASTPHRNTMLKPRAEELRRIREQIDMTNEEFSAALDIGGPRLASYLYGRTEPSEEILTRARDLLSDSTRQVSEINRLFRKPAKEIVKDWIEMIGGDPQEPDKHFEELSAILDVNIVTVKRWWEGKVGLKPIRAYPYHRKLCVAMKRRQES